MSKSLSLVFFASLFSLAACEDSSSTEKIDDGGMGTGALDGNAAPDATLVADGATSVLDATLVADGASVDAPTAAHDAAPDATVAGDAGSYTPCDFTDAPTLVIEAIDTSESFSYPKTTVDIFYSNIFFDSVGDPFVVAFERIYTETSSELHDTTYDFVVSRLKRTSGTCTWSAPRTLAGVASTLSQFGVIGTTISADYDKTNDRLVAAIVGNPAGVATFSAIAVHVDGTDDSPARLTTTIDMSLDGAFLARIKEHDGQFHAAVVRRDVLCDSPDLCDRVTYVRLDVDSHGTITYNATPEGDDMLPAYDDTNPYAYNNEVAITFDAEGSPIFVWLETHPVMSGITSHLLVSRYDHVEHGRSLKLVRTISNSIDYGSNTSFDAVRRADDSVFIASNFGENTFTLERPVMIDVVPLTGSVISETTVVEPPLSVRVGYHDMSSAKLVGARWVTGRTRITLDSADGPLYYQASGTAAANVQGLVAASGSGFAHINSSFVSALSSSDSRLWTSFYADRGEISGSTLGAAGVYVWRESAL